MLNDAKDDILMPRANSLKFECCLCYWPEIILAFRCLNRLCITMLHFLILFCLISFIRADSGDSGVIAKNVHTLSSEKL